MIVRFTREAKEIMKIVIRPALGSVFKKIAFLMFKEQASCVKKPKDHANLSKRSELGVSFALTAVKTDCFGCD